MPAAVGRVVAAPVAEGAGFSRAQIVIGRFRLEGDVAADRGVGGFSRGGAGLNIDAAIHIRVDVIATDAKRIQAGTADVAASGRIRLRDAVDINPDAVAFQPTNVITGIAAAVEAAFAITRAAAGAGRAD